MKEYELFDDDTVTTKSEQKHHPLLILFWMILLIICIAFGSALGSYFYSIIAPYLTAV